MFSTYQPSIKKSHAVSLNQTKEALNTVEQYTIKEN